MIANVIEFEGTAEQITSATTVLETEVYPQLSGMDGLVESVFLVQSETGKALLITLWDSKRDVEAAEERWRDLSSTSGALEATGGQRTALGTFRVTARTGAT